jgi:hypothetical protein
MTQSALRVAYQNYFGDTSLSIAELRAVELANVGK